MLPMTSGFSEWLFIPELTIVTIITQGRHDNRGRITSAAGLHVKSLLLLPNVNQIWYASINFRKTPQYKI
jgi:hypothetical protein